METNLVSLREASRICGVSLATMNRWVRASGVRLVRAAGEKWIKRTFLAGLLRGHDLPVPFEFECWPRVLIVEDEDDLRLAIEQHMRKWWNGADIRGVGDGERALKALTDYRPDLAVVDVNLPGKDGIALCREVALEPKLAHTKILVMTGLRDKGINARAFEEGAVEFLPKPFEPDALLAAAQRLLGSFL
jgi:CheY-like chemotaxis protein